MYIHNDAFRISSTETGRRLEVAAELLKEGSANVLLENSINLRASAEEVACEVISFGTLAPEIQVESAKQLLSKSTIASFIDQKLCRWCVIADCGTSSVLLWRESQGS